MQFVDEFRNPDIARRLIDDISRISHRMADRLGRPVQVMEVCGGHTHTIFRYGLAGMLPSSVEFVHGPGCPVCVLPIGRVDDCVAIAHQPGVILATFGDAARVPGSRYSLLEAKAAGADVRIVYSPLDALQLARANPDREVVFFALGFETTMPSTALTVLQARSEGLHNFSLFCNHITIVPTLRALLDDDQLLIDGFLGPGHVSVIIGCRPYEFIAEQYRKPMVVAGFEPLDILQSLHMVLVQLDESRAQVQNQYARVVSEAGNAFALDAVDRVFELRESFEWRGLGDIPQSGVRMRATFALFDAEQKFRLPGARAAEPQGCQCGDVLRGRIKPAQCTAFGTTCTPQTPIGALMVSSEGACAAHYQYGRVSLIKDVVATD